MTQSYKTCTWCGAPAYPHLVVCDECGHRFDTPKPGEPATPTHVGSQPLAPKPFVHPFDRPREISDYDPLRFLIAVVAAVVLGFAGLQMYGLESVSGDSLAEAFYHTVGIATWGIAVLSLAVGLRRG